MDHIELIEKLFDENADPADYVFEVAEVVTNLVERLREAQERCNILSNELKHCNESKLAKAHEALTDEWVKEKKRADEAEIKITELVERLRETEKERDAAVKDLCIAEECETCKTKTCVLRRGRGKCRYEWRGKPD